MEMEMGVTTSEETEVLDRLQILHSRLTKLDDDRRDTQEAITTERRNLIAIRCPYRVGQRFTTKTHPEMEISSIEPDYYNHHDDDYIVYARKVLKSGNLHASRMRIWNYELEGANFL